jgi:pheromone shutdown protein TraB
MSSIQNEIGQDFGVLPGSDMMAAVDTAKDAGAPVFFIDRDVSITINRLVRYMPFREKVRLFGGALLSLLPFKRTVSPSQFDERFIASLLDDFRKFSPSAYRVLIEERNIYMGRTVLDLIRRSGDERGSIIIVVGAGHLPGMHAWLEREANDIEGKEERIAGNTGSTDTERDSGQGRVI